MRLLPALALLTLSACNIELPDSRNCEVRRAFYADDDGDGVGDDDSAVYIGCEAPVGYVDVPPSVDTDSDTDTDSDSDSEMNAG